jgi:hypothetical protein
MWKDLLGKLTHLEVKPYDCYIRGKLLALSLIISSRVLEKYFTYFLHTYVKKYEFDDYAVMFPEVL